MHWISRSSSALLSVRAIRLVAMSPLAHISMNKRGIEEHHNCNVEVSLHMHVDCCFDTVVVMFATLLAAAHVV